MQHQQEEGKKPIGKLIQERKPGYLDKRIRVSEDFTFYGITKTKSGEPDISIAFKIILADGSQSVIQYHELISPMRFDGATTIKLSTLTLDITIKGKNLSDIIDYLAEHRLVWIKEPDSDFVEVKEGEVEIENIKVDEKYSPP